MFISPSLETVAHEFKTQLKYAAVFPEAIACMRGHILERLISSYLSKTNSRLQCC